MEILDLRRYANAKRVFDQAKTKGQTSQLDPDLVNMVMDVQGEIWQRKQAEETGGSEG